MMTKHMDNKISQCFKCRRAIDIETQIYYVFIGKTNTENSIFCVDCYLQDVKDMTELDPSLSHIYAHNFIRMNK